MVVADESPESRAQRVARLDPAARKQFLSAFSDEELAQLPYLWSFWARPNQISPTDEEWFVWLLLAGRGFGKTRSGAERIRGWAEDARDSGKPMQLAFVGQTAGDVRDVMVEGKSGILSVSPPWWRPVYVAGTRSVTWPDGTKALLFSGDRPNQLRGPEFHKAWIDEPAKFQYPEETFANLELCLRLGQCPQVVATTTPRPIPLLKSLLADPDTRVTKGSSFENVGNLSSRFIARVIKRFVGTREGRQELFAEMLTDTPGALWTLDRLEALRIRMVLQPDGVWRHQKLPEFTRIVVAVDPAGSSLEGANETGITVQGRGIDRHGYLLADRSAVRTPGDWARVAVDAYREFKADLIVGEKNNGGEMVAHTIHTYDPTVPVRLVSATRGKGRRAEPIAALTEQGKIHHVGTFATLEDQLTQLTTDDYLGSGSPDRADAYVWGMTELMIRESNEDPDEYTIVHH